MKQASSLLLLAMVSCLLASCGSRAVPVAELTPAERDLLTAINNYRSSHGKKALTPSASLTELARTDAKRRASSGQGYVDNRLETGYERMLTLAGTARSGPEFGKKLMDFWANQPAQREWLKDDYASVGVGTAAGESKLETGVVLLGGFAGGGF
ncbi:CAP domain-containing protein [Roseibacillus ishigakijimensis]|uniref:CAP domain-containing protein n=1 Tax=Roseibacillus ishigakijimensis TaxID=454146 RepID=A0A934VIP6_9BACT|nr:CAP domain-containing protein [Roseibacillus ishigakijimensis]MBK1835293.1 CAP domain-containing protein [Roseibacillus ishigakijimensis]